MIRPHSGGKFPTMHRLIAASLIAAALTLTGLATPLLVSGPAAAQTKPPQPVDTDRAYRQRVEERLSGMDYQMRTLTGQVEQLQFRLRRSETLVKKLNAEVAALKAEVADIKKAQAAAPQPAPVMTATPDAASPEAPAGTLPSGDAQVKYNEAQGLLRVGRFKEAEAAFVSFRRTFPDHQLSANAHYWMGEAQYAQQRYQEAATTFLEAWQEDTQGPKAPDNMYKLGMSMLALEKKDEACASFAKLLSDYRGASRRIRNMATRERKSLECS